MCYSFIVCVVPVSPVLLICSPRVTVFTVTHAMQYDLSLPLNVLYDLVEVMRERCEEMARCTVGYGHIGDGMYP